MLLSEFLQESIDKAKAQGFYIYKGGWFESDLNDKITAMCPFSCAYYNCTGKLPNIYTINPDTGNEVYDVDEVLEVVILPKLEGCCTNVIPSFKLADFISNYDDGEINENNEPIFWSADDMIEAIREEEGERNAT